MKTVSVIIPFYSHVEWLCEAIDSVLAQTYPILEIIVVNDGSKEDVSRLCDKYGDKIKYIYQENAGPAAARNNGIRQAIGDYIAFEDADDVWLPTKIEKQVFFMEQVEAMWSHTGFYYWWPQKGKLKLVNTGRDYGDIYMQRLISTQIATPAVMLNRNIFRDGDFYFPESIRNGEDDQLYTKIAKRYKIALIQEPLLKVRMRGTNSQSHAVERFHLRVQNYKLWRSAGENLTPMTHVIYAFYRLYSRIFRDCSSVTSDFFAKCFWTIPYMLERIYVRYLFACKEKDERYILRNED